MRPQNKPRLDRMNQSSFDCIFARPLATPNNRQEADKRIVEAGCMVAMRPVPLMSAANPCLWQGPGTISGPASIAGRAAAP
jgi:hypothetical protein